MIPWRARLRRGLLALSQYEDFDLLRDMFEKLKEILGDESRTVKLWIQYISYIHVLKDFIRQIFNECNDSVILF